MSQRQLTLVDVPRFPDQGAINLLSPDAAVCLLALINPSALMWYS
ncbi:hypothetical protein [Scytonema sp. HK-05]|nr:hypothetical protein [Scytonema sp. HK-05]